MRTTTMSTVFLAVLAVAMIGLNDSARATLITWDFTVKVAAEIGTPYEVGDIVSGSIVLDDSGLSSIDPRRGDYPNGLVSYQFGQFSGQAAM